jgi:hypothetical protein
MQFEAEAKMQPHTRNAKECNQGIGTVLSWRSLEICGEFVACDCKPRHSMKLVKNDEPALSLSRDIR